MSTLHEERSAEGRSQREYSRATESTFDGDRCGGPAEVESSGAKRASGFVHIHVTRTRVALEQARHAPPTRRIHD